MKQKSADELKEKCFIDQGHALKLNESFSTHYGHYSKPVEKSE